MFRFYVYVFYVCQTSVLNFPMSASLMYFQPFLMFQLNFLKLCHHLCVETAIWEDRLQQGHVQQVDKSGQGPRGWPQDIQDCRCSIIPTFCCRLFWLRSVFSLRCVFLIPRWRAWTTRSGRNCFWCRKATALSWKKKKRMSWRRENCSLKCKSSYLVSGECVPFSASRWQETINWYSGVSLLIPACLVLLDSSFHQAQQ